MALQALEATQNNMVAWNLGVMLDIIVEKNICKRSFLVQCFQGSSDAYYLSLVVFTGPGDHPEQHGGLISRGTGWCHCLEEYLLKKFPCTMLPGLWRANWLPQELQCSLSNWLSLWKPVKKAFWSQFCLHYQKDQNYNKVLHWMLPTWDRRELRRACLRETRRLPATPIESGPRSRVCHGPWKGSLEGQPHCSRSSKPFRRPRQGCPTNDKALDPAHEEHHGKFGNKFWKWKFVFNILYYE